MLPCCATAADHTSLATITIHGTPSNRPNTFTLRMRIPHWTDASAKVSLLASDTHADYKVTPGAYFDLTR